MQPSLSPAKDSESTIHRIGKSVSDLIADWSAADVFDARQILAENPEFKDDQSVILDLAYEEYCRRTEKGEEIAPSEFARRFPGVETPLLDLIDVHQVLYDNPSVLSNGVAPQWPEVGESHLDLKLLQRIGSGSFSHVYIASESGVGERRVVAKLCINANHEASLLGRLEHPNIVPILSVKKDRQKNLSAICMPYMGRTTLAHAIEFFKQQDHQTVTPGDLIEMLFEREQETVPAQNRESGFFRRSQLQDVKIDIAIQLCHGLEFAHSRGVIHGDLKPSNILLTKQGTALLMDFNLSQKLRPESQAIGGTLAYMAPEQLAILSQDSRGSQAVTCNERTDVYSFGVLLAELFTGAHPFSSLAERGATAESAKQLFDRQQKKIVTARDLAPEIGVSLARIIEKCLAFDPDQRWSGVGELRAALEKTVTLKNRSLRWIRRKRKLVFGICLVVCALVTGGVLYASLPTQSEQLLSAATTALDEGRTEAAISDLKLARTLENPPPQIFPLLGQAFFQSGTNALNDERYADAVADFNEARELDFNLPQVSARLSEALLRSGEQALKGGRLSDAVSYLEQARENAPGSPEVLLRLSRAYLANEQFEDALELTREWKKLHEKSSKPIANLAFCYFEKDRHTKGKADFGRARIYFERALASPFDVSKAALLNNIGLCHCRNNQLEKALEPLFDAVQNSSELPPEDRVVPCVLYLSAERKVSFRERRLPDLAQIENCISTAPDSAEVLFEAACCYVWASEISKGDPVQSENYVQRCLEYCIRASRIGLTSADLDEILKIQPQLADRAEWQVLKDNAVEQRVEEYQSLLLDPLQ